VTNNSQCVSLVAGLKEWLVVEVAQGKSGYLPVCASVAICTLSQDTIKVQVPLDFNVCECCDLNGKFIRFSFPGEKAASPGVRNATSVLIEDVPACTFCMEH
jgi:hypothetical protein